MEIGATAEVDGAGVESELTHYLAELEDGYIKVTVSRPEEDRPTLVTVSHIKDAKTKGRRPKAAEIEAPRKLCDEELAICDKEPHRITLAAIRENAQ